MNLNCLNSIITDNLAIHIDLTNINSWDLNSGLTSISLTKWTNAISDNINLIDFGLTEFDNGRTNIMWSGITLTPNDTLLTMYRIGYNEVTNPNISGQTGGVTAITRYDNYNISGITNNLTGNYFELNGGYLQGFIGLDGYNYKLLPYRFINGITIETLINIYSNSQGIFYMMGTRAEDKYNPFYSGEFISGLTTITGVTTSENNYLEAFLEEEVLKNNFIDFNNKTKIQYTKLPQINNLINNALAFELTQDKKIAYKYIDNNGQIITNKSNAIITNTGFTMIAISFRPDVTIDDVNLIDCYEQRYGRLIIYVNGRPIWIIDEFPEFYFKRINNDSEKQIGVPYSISWGGGSFGLKHSWHYDYQTHLLYGDNDTEYIKNNFYVQNNTTPTDCIPNPIITPFDGLNLSADTETFLVVDTCNLDVQTNLNVMRIEYTGATNNSGNTYYLKYNQPISILSNREYTIDLLLYNTGFFKQYDDNGNSVINKLTILLNGDIDIEIINDVEYTFPLTTSNLRELYTLTDLEPFPDKQEYQYIKNGIMYYGKTGIPVYTGNVTAFGTLEINDENDIPLTNIQNIVVTGENQWVPIKVKFKINDNTGQQFIDMGILLESTDTFNLDTPLFISNFTYTGADILVQDPRKDNLLIEQNFNSGFIGGIQKLRIYDNALTSPEILHNAVIESKQNPYLNMEINKGGRIIYR